MRFSFSSVTFLQVRRRRGKQECILNIRGVRRDLRLTTWLCNVLPAQVRPSLENRSLKTVNYKWFRAEGICTGQTTMWHYDQKYKQCNSFEYGGCLGNANRFKGREECEQTCVQTASLSVSTNKVNVSATAIRETYIYWHKCS